MASFPYNPNIPQASDNPADSQGEILTNFGSINNILAVDHFTFGSMTSTDGQHQQVTLPVPLSGAPAAPVGTASEIYTNALAGIAQLFFINSTGPKQITGLPLVTTRPGATGFGLVTPWGIVINFGSVGTVTPGGNAITFQVPFPSSLDAVVTTSANNNPSSNCTVGAQSVNGCTLFSSQTNSAYFIAIGH